MPATNSKSIAILGAGVTGLAAAYRLAARGHRVRVFERHDRVGGAVGTEISDGWLVEAGPNSLQESPELSSLIRDLGLASERVEAGPQAKNRFLLKGGRAVAVPMSGPAFFKSDFLSAGAKLRLLGELLKRRKDRESEVSLAEFVRDHFGSEILDRAVQPIVSGIYAGDPAVLSAREAFPKLVELERTHGSVLRGMIAGMGRRRKQGQGGPARIISFRRGLQALPEALAARLPEGAVSLRTSVQRIIPGARWRVAFRHEQGETDDEFDAVISALPAQALAELTVGEDGLRPLAPLSQIDHPPVSSLFLGFRRDQVAHPLDGFGILVPALERRWVLGVLFSSSLFPGRAPEGHVALTVMTGGSLQPEIGRLMTVDLISIVLADLRSMLGITGEPVFWRHNFWPKAIAQYNIGFASHRRLMADCESANPGLFIGGQVRDGISVPDCLAAGLKLAERACPSE
ncbi:MAG: protoporphyrinogen oxidase [Opitutaceae bacterium]|jgi:oxygen-dependent protoporphyrinogen oxidase